MKDLLALVGRCRPLSTFSLFKHQPHKTSQKRETSLFSSAGPPMPDIKQKRENKGAEAYQDEK
jgi:hypothetical protein